MEMQLSEEVVASQVCNDEPRLNDGIQQQNDKFDNYSNLHANESENDNIVAVTVESVDYVESNAPSIENFTNVIEHIENVATSTNIDNAIETESIAFPIAAGFVIPANFQVTEVNNTKELNITGNEAELTPVSSEKNNDTIVFPNQNEEECIVPHEDHSKNQQNEKDIVPTIDNNQNEDILVSQNNESQSENNLTEIDDTVEESIDGQQRKAGIGKGRRKRRKSQLTTAQSRKFTKKKLKEFEEHDDHDENGEPMNKKALAKALDLKFNYLDEQEIDEDKTENEEESHEEVMEMPPPKRRGRKPRTKSIEADTDVIINQKRSCRGRNIPQQFDIDSDDDDDDPDIEPEKEKQQRRRGRRPSLKNTLNDTNPLTRIKRSTLPPLTISPSSKSKKKIKIIIEKFETANLPELTPKNLYQFITKTQVVEYLEFGKTSQFINYDSLKQPVNWRLEQLKILQSKLIDYNQKVKQHEAEYKRMRRQDPEYRERERQRNKEAKRKLRQDPEYRRQELINMTRARQLAKFRKLQLEFIEQEELMLEKRLLEGSSFPPPTPTPAPTPMTIYEPETPMTIEAEQELEPEPEPEPPSNNYVNNESVNPVMPTPMQQQHEQQQQLDHHRMLIDHNDYTCMTRENVVYHPHHEVQNKFEHGPDQQAHADHTSMTNHNVSFTSLLINGQLLDCELHGEHE